MMARPASHAFSLSLAGQGCQTFSLEVDGQNVNVLVDGASAPSQLAAELQSQHGLSADDTSRLEVGLQKRINEIAASRRIFATCRAAALRRRLRVAAGRRDGSVRRTEEEVFDSGAKNGEAALPASSIRCKIPYGPEAATDFIDGVDVGHIVAPIGPVGSCELRSLYLWRGRFFLLDENATDDPDEAPLSPLPLRLGTVGPLDLRARTDGAAEPSSQLRIPRVGRAFLRAAASSSGSLPLLLPRLLHLLRRGDGADNHGHMLYDAAFPLFWSMTLHEDPTGGPATTTDSDVLVLDEQLHMPFDGSSRRLLGLHSPSSARSSFPSRCPPPRHFFSTETTVQNTTIFRAFDVALLPRGISTRAPES
jgi:hypothetical protein